MRPFYVCAVQRVEVALQRAHELLKAICGRWHSLFFTQPRRHQRLSALESIFLPLPLPCSLNLTFTPPPTHTHMQFPSPFGFPLPLQPHRPSQINYFSEHKDQHVSWADLKLTIAILHQTTLSRKSCTATHPAPKVYHLSSDLGELCIQ